MGQNLYEPTFTFSGPVKVLAIILTDGNSDIIDIAGNCTLTSRSGPRGTGHGPYLVGPTFISRRARLNGRGYKYSRFLMYMPNLLSQAPNIIKSVKNLISDMKPAKMTVLFGKELSPDPVSQFPVNNSPGSITRDPAGNTYVCNDVTNQVEKYNPDGSFNSNFVALNAPGYVMYFNNLIYISWNLGSISPTVSVYDLFAAHQFDFSGAPSPDIFGGMAVDKLGNVYVVDYIAGFIDYFDGTTGVYINQFAFPITGGPLFAMGKIAIDPGSGNLYIIDANHNNDVQVWTPYPGTPANIFNFGSPYSNLPVGIFFDSRGLVYVSNSGDQTIAVFAPDGTIRYVFGSLGTALGQFEGPIDVFIDSADNLFVSESGGERIQKFTYHEIFQEL
jgi:sugar lactone lactonase YvrE